MVRDTTGVAVTDVEPDTELTAFSSEGASATAWARARAELEAAEVFWLSTVRPDGRPHVTPLLAVWSGDALYFSTGPSERKAKNLAAQAPCVLTTGCNRLDGLDVVVEGEARRVRDTAELDRVATAFVAKHPRDVGEPGGTWFGLGDAIRAGEVLLFRVAPVTAFAFGKGEPYGETRYRFPPTPRA